MSSGDVAPEPAEREPLRRASALRLAIVVTVGVAAFLTFWVFDVVDEDDVRSIIDPFGPLAPLAYVVIGALLGLALVPGPLLAGTSGLLFGAGVGFVVTMGSAILSAVLALLIGRRAIGAPPARFDRLAAIAQRRGFLAVVFQRLIPGVPDPPANYAFGSLGVSIRQIALGTLVGSAPRAFSYTSIGASLDDPSSPLAVVAVVVLVITVVAGAEVTRRVVKRR